MRVSRRTLVLRIDVVQIADQLRGYVAIILLRRSKQSACIFHDGEFESGMRLGLLLQQHSRAVGGLIVRTEPIHHSALYSPAHHVGNLALHLCRIS